MCEEKKTGYPSIDKPWLKYYDEEALHAQPAACTVYQNIYRHNKEHLNDTALEYFGVKISFSKLFEQVEVCAKALLHNGVRPGDCVTLCTSGTPEAIYIVLACSKIGALANFVNPMFQPTQIRDRINETNASFLFVLDKLYSRISSIVSETCIQHLVVLPATASLPAPLRILSNFKDPAVPALKQALKTDCKYCLWSSFLKTGSSSPSSTEAPYQKDTPVVMVYSSGTTGASKGIVLTNKNFNALGQQVIAANPMFRPGDRMLAAMPLFHGFGLGVCVHTMLSQGGRCILIPRFTAKSYAKQIVKYKCNFIAGVPTLYEALLRLPSMDGANLSSLKGVFSGGDSLSIELKKKFDKFLYDHKASIQVREGYGTTETVTACCLTPPHMFKEGSIGLPFPDTYIKIVEPDTDREVPYGQEGEILLAGPTVMKEYMNNPEETAQTLRTHADGLTWVYTGDLGMMDEQGFVYFRGRAKRMIISSGYNVYPGQIENILDAHEYVQMSCVIGVPDPYKMQKVKAFVKLAQGVPATEETKQVLLAYCRKNVAKYAMPYDIEFKEDMPKTLVGKVAYRQLEEEELAKIKAAEEK